MYSKTEIMYLIHLLVIHNVTETTWCTCTCVSLKKNEIFNLKNVLLNRQIELGNSLRKLISHATRLMLFFLNIYVIFSQKLKKVIARLLYFF